MHTEQTVSHSKRIVQNFAAAHMQHKEKKKKKPILSYEDQHHHPYAVSENKTEERWPSMVLQHHAVLGFDVPFTPESRFLTY